MVNALTTSISREPNCDGPAVIRDDYLTSTPAVRFAQTAVIRRRRGDKGPWQDPVPVPSRQWRRAGRGPGRARAIREMVAPRAQRGVAVYRRCFGRPGPPDKPRERGGALAAASN